MLLQTISPVFYGKIKFTGEGVFMEEFKDRLTKLRKEKQLYQKELAEVVGVSDGAIGMYETGKRTPDKDILAKLATYFDVSIDYLLGQSKERFPADKFKETILNDPELRNFLRELPRRQELQKLIKQVQNLSPQEINKIIKIIEIFIEDEQ